jgi:hypothetical protein
VKIFAIALASLIASTMLVDHAGASSEKSSHKNLGIVHVKEYVRKNGTHVKPSCRTLPNETKKDNWSSLGNVNPCTGKKGTKRP